MKTDARVRYTRMIIQKTFLSLLNEKPIRSITVKEICQKAGINRTTFYKHYRDTYDLLEAVQEQASDALLELINKYAPEESGRVLLIILDQIYKNRDKFRNFLQNSSDYGFLYKTAIKCFLQINENSKKSGAEGKGFLSDPLNFSYFAGAIGGVIGYWAAGGMKETPEEIASCISRLSKPLFKES